MTSSQLSQQEFDELPGEVVHFLVWSAGKAFAECSGYEVDPERWADSKRLRKQCQACYRLEMVRLREEKK